MATILVVDDHITSRQFLVTLLGYQGHRLLEAGNGEEALQSVHNEVPDLIITDLMMPRMDGYELAFRLRSDPTIDRMPVIFYTAGYDVDEAHDLAHSCGVVHIVSKPSEPEAILSYVASALQFQAPLLSLDRSGDIEWAQDICAQHHQLLVNKLTRQVNLLEQEIVVRKRAEEAVCTLNAELEARVVERTAGLNKLNAYLRIQLHANERARVQIEMQTKQIRQQCDELASQKAQLAEANSWLAGLASTDGLTGLKNRRTFQVCLEQEYVRARRYEAALSLVLVDVDAFKQYNDSFGHPAGDAALRQVATLLEKTVRQPDIVARYGGEEFAIILPNTDREGAMMMAERLREIIDVAPWRYRPVTASIGIASLTLGITCAAELVQDADRALYVAKRTGRNRSIHCEDLVCDARTAMPQAIVTCSDLQRKDHVTK